MRLDIVKGTDDCIFYLRAGEEVKRGGGLRERRVWERDRETEKGWGGVGGTES